MPENNGQNQAVRVNIYGINTIGKHIGQAVMTGGLLFLGAGTWDWPWGWVFAAVTLACWIGLSAALAIGNPELLNQRGQRVKNATAGTPRWDLAILSVYAVLVLLQPFAAGLDRRYSVSGPVAAPILIVGNLLLVLGFALLAWSMVANRHFEPTARIQESRAHQTITGGPFRYVRHPGYAGVILQFAALPLALGTWLALLPGVLGGILFIVRTALEDRMLLAKLPGYADYARRTR
ncbi:MAG: isoprenylcysteine carboxylmethyltransferase family protein, partial [Anaerolineae bacterium]|nr:isoprenylcysteine carboxylmethyltransferase family protein [Anaerolineae bacterium]